jgi:hypothetical protein
MTIHATLGDALMETDHDHRLLTRVFVRASSDEPFKQITTLSDYEPFHTHVIRCARLSDDALIAELRGLRRSQRVTNPSHWSMWFLTFVMMPSFLHSLQLRAGEMKGRATHATAIRRALAHAQGALGLGARSVGAPRRTT